MKLFSEIFKIVAITSLVAFLVFPLIAWMFPLSNYPDGHYYFHIRRALSLFISMGISFLLQRLVFK